jgi:hypothetical protein
MKEENLAGSTSTSSRASHYAIALLLELVGLSRFELLTPRLSSVCSNQLSYRPSSPLSRHSPRWPPGPTANFSKNQPQADSFKTRQDVCCATPGRYQIDLIGLSALGFGLLGFPRA